MNKKKVIVVAVALIAIIVIVACTAAALLYNGKDDYAQRIDAAYRYLEEGDYEQAILIFEQAIEMDDTREDAYLGLYTTYMEMGDEETARQVIRKAVGVTDSDKIQDLLDQINQDGAGDGQQAGSNLLDNESEIVDKGHSLVLNVDMLEMFGSANYGDYVQNFGNPDVSMVNGACYVRVDGLPAELMFCDTTSERVIDQVKGVPYGIYLPAQIHLDNVTALFGGKSVSYDALKDINGLSDLEKNGSEITFAYKNCEILIICDKKDQITASSENTITITDQIMAAEQHTLQATVVDGTTGNPVQNVKVKAYEGYNTWGTATEGKTNASGIVELDLENSGTYTLEFIKDGYVTETAEVFVYETMSKITANFSIVPVTQEDVIRLVLTWGSAPSDLDSYLIGSSGDGTATNVNFRNMTETDRSGQKIAELDVDDTSSYGPETITIYDTQGAYKFCVVDYDGTGTMSYSSAQVKIYVGSTLYTTVDIPSGLENGWHVCDIINGEISVVNRPQAVQNGSPK